MDYDSVANYRRLSLPKIIIGHLRGADAQEFLKKFRTSNLQTASFPNANLNYHFSVINGEGIVIEEHDASIREEGTFGLARVLNNHITFYALGPKTEEEQIKLLDDLSQKIGAVFDYRRLRDPALELLEERGHI
jgi:hypothetical protein